MIMVGNARHYALCFTYFDICPHNSPKGQDYCEFYTF